MTTRKLYQRIVASILEAIEAGEYAPGARLSAERNLAEEFKVSRPTIREAMIALEIRGLVEACHGSGLYVTRGEQIDRRFHVAIAVVTKNSVMRDAVEMLWNPRYRSPLCVHMFAHANRSGINPRPGEHRAILATCSPRVIPRRPHGNAQPPPPGDRGHIGSNRDGRAREGAIRE